MQASKTFRKYLGFPIFRSMPKHKDFLYIINNIHARLNGWKAKFLNMSSLTVLVKFTLKGISFHVMQYI